MLLPTPCGFHLAETVEEWARTPRPSWYRELPAARLGRSSRSTESAYFSRPGPRVIDGIELLAEGPCTDAFEEIAPVGSWTPLTS